jgi:hypothetical protein
MGGILSRVLRSPGALKSRRHARWQGSHAFGSQCQPKGFRSTNSNVIGSRDMRLWAMRAPAHRL